MKTVLYITNQGLTLYQNKHQEVEFVCSLDWAGNSCIERLLEELAPKTPVSIILDLLEEEIAVEDFPRLRFWEKKALKNQHVQQQYDEGAQFVHASWSRHVQGDGVRSESTLLISSITSSTVLSKLMRYLEDAKIMLIGVYSATILLVDYFKQELVPELELSKEQLSGVLFLISRQSDNVYRQAFIKQSVVKMSRLIEINDDLEDSQGFSDQFLSAGLKTILIDEIKLAQNYLYNQRVIRLEEPISYIFMDSDHQRLEGLEALSQALELTRVTDVGGPKHSFRVINFNADLTEKKRPLSKCQGSKILADFLIRQRPNTHFNPRYVRKVNAQQLGTHSLVAVNSLIVLALLIYITLSVVDSYIGKDRLQQLEQGVVNHRVEEVRLQKKVQRQVNAQELKAKVELSETLLALKADRALGVDIKSIAKVVAQQAENIQLIKIDWKQLGQFDSQRYQIEFYGLVYPFTDYYQEPVSWVDDFSAALTKLHSVTTVEIVKEPLNRDLKQALTVVTNESRKRVNALPFQIMIEVDYASSE